MNTLNQPLTTSLNFAAAVELCGGQEVIAREIIQMLVNELPQQSQELQESLDKKNWKNLDYISHKLAGSAAYCGMEEIKRQAREVNTLLRQQKFAELSQEMARLQKAIKDALLAASLLDIIPQAEE